MATKRFVSKDNLGRVWTRLFGKVLNSKEEIEANKSENMIAGADAVKEVYSSLGDISGFTNTTYDSLGDFIQYCVDNGYLPDINSFPLIPVMTSNTDVNGKVIYNAYNGNSFPAQGYGRDGLQYYAFDEKNNTCVCINAENIAGAWIGYEFNQAKKVTQVKAKMGNFTPNNSFTVKYQYYDDNTLSWVDGGTRVVSGYNNGTYEEFVFNIKKPIYSKKHRLYVVEKKVETTNLLVVSLQLYGK